MRVTLGACGCLLTLLCTGCPPAAPPAGGLDAAGAKPSATPAPTATATATATASATVQPVVEGPPVLVEQRLAENAYVMGWSPSGLHVAIGTSGGVHFIDAETGQSRGVLPRFADAGKLSSDGRYLVTLHTSSRYADVWDLSTDVVRPLQIPAWIEAIATTAGDRVLLGHAGGVTVIDPGPATVKTFPLGDAELRIRAVQGSEAGFIAAGAKETLFVLDAEGHVARKVTRGKDDEAFALSSAGKYLSFAEGSDVLTTSPGGTASPARSTACDGGRPSAMAWTADERHLVVACAPASRGDEGSVRVLGADGKKERDLTSTSGAASLEVSSQSVAVIAPGEDVVVFDAASGQKVRRLVRPPQASDAPVLSPNLDRAVFSRHHETANVRLVGASGPFGPRFKAEAHFLTEDARHGNLLGISGDLPPTHLDLATQKLVPPPENGTLSADGTTYLISPQDSDSFELMDRATGKKVLAPHARRGLGGCSFSKHGRWVHCTDEDLDGKTRSRLFDGKTGRLRATHGQGLLVARDVYQWNSDDSLFEEGRFAAAARGGGECKYCLATEVYDALTGKKLFSIAPLHKDAPRARFMGDGKHIYWEGEVFDARTGKLAWTLPKGMRVVNAERYGGTSGEVEAWTAPQGLLVSTAEKTLLVDYATGKTLHEMDRVDRAYAISPGARFFLTQVGTATFRWEMATWTRVPTRLTSTCFAELSEDGELAYCVDGALLVHRFSDGRTLRRVLPAFDFEITDEGVFDPTTAAPGFALVRKGPDVLRSPMGPLSILEPRFGHPGLFADFQAGKPLSPKP